MTNQTLDHTPSFFTSERSNLIAGARNALLCGLGSAAGGALLIEGLGGASIALASLGVIPREFNIGFGDAARALTAASFGGMFGSLCYAARSSFGVSAAFTGIEIDYSRLAKHGAGFIVSTALAFGGLKALTALHPDEPHPPVQASSALLHQPPQI